MAKLFKRALILLLPLLVISVYFFIKDPMKIIHDIEDPTSKGVLMNDRLYQVEYLKRSNIEYNGFIFGSSRSKAFKTKNWNTFTTSEITPYHMGVNDETLYGLERKINYLDSLGYQLDHVLIVMDHRLLSLLDNHEAHVFREHYALTGETSSSFYQRFVNAFFNFSFLKEYFSYQSTGKVEHKGEFLWDPGFRHNATTGDIFYVRMDSLIRQDSMKFYKENNSTFHKRKKSISKELINKQAMSYLMKIKHVLTTNKSSFKLVVTPNYDLVQLNQKDLKKLELVFGKLNVFDYSGSNQFTNEVGNYYEHKHFKPYIANSLMKLVYQHE